MVKKTVSQAVSTADFKAGKLNLITAPCGSGKTHFILNTLVKQYHGNSNIVYLIDTVNGKQSIRNKGDWRENEEGELYRKLDGISVYTYAGFAEAINKNRNLWMDNTYIVCDELQNCIQYSRFNNWNIHLDACLATFR